jgi:hyperosmotically inducible protein
MKIRSALMTAAVSLALAGLAGCGDRDADTNKMSGGPNTTTTPPADTTPPPASAPTAPDTTASTPPATTPPASGGSADRSAGQSVDDAAVTAKVKAALLAESGVDGTKINVDTVNGTVTLKGEVPDKGMIDKAVQVAKGVDGVKDVDNKLSASAG